MFGYCEDFVFNAERVDESVSWVVASLAEGLECFIFAGSCARVPCADAVFFKDERDVEGVFVSRAVCCEKVVGRDCWAGNLGDAERFSYANKVEPAFLNESFGGEKRPIVVGRCL